MADTETTGMWEELKLGYTESWGHPLLREEIARLYRGIDQAGVLTTVPEEGIYLTMRALLKPGDHIICTFPGYQSLYEVARSMGCEVSYWEPDEEQGWKFPIAELEKKMRSSTRLVVVNFPHNPTGFAPGEEDFVSLVELVSGQGAYLLSDEMYRFLEVVDGSTLPAACDLYEKAISLSGLSNTFGLPGLRIGWLASQDEEVMQAVARLKDYTTICSSAPGEILAIIALRSKEAIIQSQVARLRRNMAVLGEFFAARQDIFVWNPPIGGSICFPRMLVVADTYDFCEKLVKETGIMLAPSRAFQFGDQHVRFGFGRENLPQVLGRFAEYIDQC